MLGTGAGTVVLGVVLVLLGALGATRTSAPRTGRARPDGAVPRGVAGFAASLVPFGVLIGAGGALVRGGDLVATMVAGGLLVPLVAVVGRLVEARRRTARGD